MTSSPSQAKAESRRPRRPGPAVVIWGSVALFAVLFALFTYQLSAPAEPSQHILVRKVLKRRVVTTIVPTPGASTVSAGPAVSSTQSVSGAAAPLTTGAS